MRNVGHLLRHLLVAAVGLLAPVDTNAATFCVSTPVALASAFATAASNGQNDSIRLVVGTYVGTFYYGSAEPFGLTVEGGYDSGCSTRTLNAANTIVDGAAGGTVLVLATTWAVEFRVQGVTIRNGRSTTDGGGLFINTAGGTVVVEDTALVSNEALGPGPGSYRRGGGLFIPPSPASVTLRNNLIEGNTATSAGGGVYVDLGNVGSIEVSSNRVHNNRADGGGGLYVTQVSYALIRQNEISQNFSSDSWGGISVSGGPWLSGVVFVDNYVHHNVASSISSVEGIGGAGAIGGADVLVAENRIIENSATNYAGGLLTRGKLIGNRFIGNVAVGAVSCSFCGRAGALAVPRGTILVDNVIANNQAPAAGGLWVYGATAGTPPPSLTVFTGNTIADNVATTGKGGGVHVDILDETEELEMFNNIVFGNSAVGGGNDLSIDNDVDGDFLPSPVRLLHNDFDPTAAGFFVKLPFALDPSNVNMDPLFVDSGARDYHLQPASPVVDIGDNKAPGLRSTDGEGNPRIMGNAVDLGALERSDSVVPIPGPMVIGDLDGNGIRDIAVDFGAVFGVWVFRNGTNWVPLPSFSAEAMVVSDLDNNGQDELIVDFGILHGLWVWKNDAEWIFLHSRSPDSFVTGDWYKDGFAEIVADFGPYGIYRYYHWAGWEVRPEHSRSPDSMATIDLDNDGTDDLLVDFGAPYGLWVWLNNTSWVPLHGLSPDSVTTGDLDGNGHDDLALDFGDVYGIWSKANNGSWSLVHGLSGASMAIGDIDGSGQGDLVINFGAPYGVWARLNNAVWVQLHGFSVDTMAVADLDANGKSEVILNFGPSIGVWVWQNNSVWYRLY